MSGDPVYVDRQVLAMDVSIAVRRSLRGHAKEAEHRILSTLNDEIVEFAETTNTRIEAIMKLVEREKGE
jgi:hypothetical protein